MAGKKRIDLIETPVPDDHEGPVVDGLDADIDIFLDAVEDDELDLELIVDEDDEDVRRIPIRDYLIFDTNWQLRRWRSFLAELRQRYPDLSHNGERVVKYLNDTYGTINQNSRTGKNKDQD